MQSIAHLSDDELLANLFSSCKEEHSALAQKLVFLIGVEDRRLHVQMASPSMFDFCTRRLGWSEGRSYRRIAGARLVRRYPFLLERIERGELHLSTLVMIGPYLDDENVHEVIEATRGKKRILVEVYLARRFHLKTPVKRPTYPLEVDEELVALYEWARDHFSNAIPRNDVTALTKRVFSELKSRIEKEEREALEAPKRTSKKTKQIPDANRRHVHARDGGQCIYVDPKTGERCPAKAYIQNDHIEGQADGGDHDVGNLRLACKAHNLWFAELRYGRAYIEKRIRLRQRKSQARDDDAEQESGREIGPGPLGDP